MTTNHLDSSEVNSYDYIIVGGGTAVSRTFYTDAAAAVADGTDCP
jgi:hypothetical protein